MTPDDHILLWDFTNERGTSAYDALTTKGILIYSSDTDIKKYSENQYRNIKYQIKRLRELKLIEEAIKEPNVHKAKYYKLSEYGVYYLISNDKSLPYVILRILLRNYRSHPLFQYFLYPCIKDAALLKIIDDQSIFSHMSLHLHDCCEAAKDAIDRINRNDPYNREYLFTWQNVPTATDEVKTLSDFLQRKFRWRWLSHAKFEKTVDGNGIEAWSGSNSLFISLSNDRTTATVSHRGEKKHEFNIRKFFDDLIVETTPTQTVETLVKMFTRTHHSLVQRLIFSMVSDDAVKSSNMRILAQDELFRLRLQDTKNQFEQRYELLEEGKR